MALDRLTAMSAPDPALTALWLVQVPFQNSSTTIFAETCTAPFTKIPAESRPCAGGSVHYAGFKDIDGVAITFYETHDHKVTEWLKTWQKMVFNKGVFGPPSMFKKDITVTLYSKAQSKPTRTLIYRNAWPTDRQAFELSYSEETGRLVVAAQFSVDDVDEL